MPWRRCRRSSGAPQATLLGRPERADVLHAALLNGIASHVLDFDDTHIENGHSSGRPGGAGDPGPGRAPPRERTRFHGGADHRDRDRAQDRRRGHAGALQDRLAHHRHGRGVRQRGRGRKIARLERAADVLGARSRRRPAGRIAGHVRLHDQELPPRPGGAKRPHRGAARPSRLHRLGAGARSRARLAAGAEHRFRQRRHHGPGLGDLEQQLQAVRLRPGGASGDRRLHPAARQAWPHARHDRSHRGRGPSARDGRDRDPQSGNRPRRQIQHLSRRRGGARRGGGRRAGVQRRARARRADRRIARPGIRQHRSRPRQGAGAGDDPAQERRSARGLRRARGRQRSKSDERPHARGQIPWSRGRHPAARPNAIGCSICAGARRSWPMPAISPAGRPARRWTTTRAVSPSGVAKPL